MRAKTVNEGIHFERGQDPKKSMKIGLRVKSVDEFDELNRIYRTWNNNIKNNLQITGVLLKRLMLDEEDDHSLDIIERCFDLVNDIKSSINAIPKERITNYDLNRMTDLIEPLKESIISFINSDNIKTTTWDKLPKIDNWNMDKWGDRMIENCIKTFKYLAG